MALPSVFISYNQNSPTEQTLAIRLHTIGAVHGYNMLLPERSAYSNTVSSETRTRIQQSDFFICFSTLSLTSVVQEEINIAFAKLHDKSKILVIYDEKVGANVLGVENCTSVYINTLDDPLKIVTSITEKIKDASKKKEDAGFLSNLGGLLLLGLGLFALAEAFEAPAKTSGRRKPIKKVAKKLAPKKTRRKNA
jgi:hypothetical protein